MATTHLTASMRVIRAHRAMRHVSIEAARDDVVGLATRSALTEDEKRLVAKLEKACGCSIAELAALARDWA